LALDEKRNFDRETTKRIGELGILGAVTPREYGGSGEGHVARMVAIEALSKVYPAAGFFVMTAQIGIYALQSFGTEELKTKYLPPLCRGDLIVATGVTEPTGGSDPSNMSTSAEPVGNEFEINGKKVYISHAPVCDLAIVVAKTAKGVSAFLVERGAPGFETPERQYLPGLHSVSVGHLMFTNCRVPNSNVVGEQGKGMAMAMSAINAIARTGVAAFGLGVAEGCYDAALKYARERELYGKPIAELQAVRHAIVDMGLEIEAARWLSYYAAWLLDQGMSVRETSVSIAQAKLCASQLASRTALRCIQIMGGHGASADSEVVRRLNDSLVLFAAAGSQETMKDVIGRAIIP
jgi:alkylation response protein AidB-like acyl-CoA dehydrogenase